MNTLAIILISFLSGVIIGLIFGLWLYRTFNLAGIDLKGKLKVKQRGRNNVQSPDVTANIPIQKKRDGLFSRRKARRLAKKQKKL